MTMSSPERRRWFAARRTRDLTHRLTALARSIRDDDEPAVEAILTLSRKHRMFAPLALVIGAFVMLIGGLRVLLRNWRLLLVQILPAMWIWIATADLKLHVLRGKELHVIRGAVLIPINLAIVAITIGAYFLNAVFAYAIVEPGRPEVRRALRSARRRLRPIVAIGGLIGLMLGFASTVVPRWSGPWFAICMSVVVGLMMVTYVAVPSRLIGIRPEASKRDKLAVTAISSGISVTVCTPPYLLARLGLLMLGSRPLVIPGAILLLVGAVLQTGTTAAVRAVKMGAKLIAEPDKPPPQEIVEASEGEPAGTPGPSARA